MKSLILRNIPDELAKIFQHRAHKQGVSLNKAVIGLLMEKFGLSGRAKRRVYHDLDHLSGTWKKEEADQFNKLILEERRRDTDLFWDKNP